MGVHVELAVEGEADLARPAHDVGHALIEANDRPAHLVAAGNAALRIAHQWVGQAEAVAKAIIGLLRIAGYSDNLAAGLAKGFVLPAEPAGLPDSTGGKGLVEEEDHRRAALEYLIEGAIPNGEVRNDFASLEHGGRI